MKSASTPITRQDVRTAIFAALRQNATGADRPLTLPAIAVDLHSSRSTVQRVLAAAGTTYTDELFRARTVLAVMAMGDGAAAGVAARRVGLPPDHLRVVLVRRFGIGPAGLQRCLRTERLLRSWARHPPPAHTRLYRARLGAWRGRRAQLRRYLDPIPSDSPLRPWGTDCSQHRSGPTSAPVSIAEPPATSAGGNATASWRTFAAASIRRRTIDLPEHP